MKAKHSQSKEQPNASKSCFLYLCDWTSRALRLRRPETNTEQKGELRLVLLGKTGVGKSATGNTILGKVVFESSASSSSVTKRCKKETKNINGRKISIIDTPGLFDTSLSQEQIEKEIKLCISYSAPGPHAFLVVVKPERFTEENAKSIQLIERIFGEEARDYTMVLFTQGDQLEQDIKTFICSNSALRAFVRNCMGRYFVIDNKKQDSPQVMQLVDNIDKMVSDNICGEYYTNDMLQEAERAIEKEKQRILKENQEQRKTEMHALEKNMRLNIKNKEQEKQIEKMKKQLEEKQEEEARIQAENNIGNFIRWHPLKLLQDIITFWFSK